MNHSALAGLDVGTTGCKCSVFSQDGVLLSYAYREYQTETGADGSSLLNPDTVLQSAVEVLRSASESCRQTISALSVSSLGEACIPLSVDGRPLDLSMLCTDPRGGEQCRQLIDAVGAAEINRITGVPPQPMYTLCKIMWIRQNRPDVFARTWKFMCYGDFISYRLTGIPRIAASLAARTMAFDITAQDWSPRMLAAAGISRDLLSETCAAGEPIGTVTREMARLTGLSEQTVLAAGGHDQICAAAGGGILTPGQALNGMGTVDCVTPVFEGVKRGQAMADGNFACVPAAVNGLYATYAFNFGGGSVIKWYRDQFAQELSQEALGLNRSVYALMDERCTADPTGILVLPHFSGAATPYMDAHSVGAVVGLTLQTDRSTLYRALLEGVAYEMLLNIRCLEQAGIAVSRLSACGGGARSDVWLQIKSDICGLPIDALAVEEAGTAGAAMLAGKAAGVYGSLREAAERFVTVKKTFYPQAGCQSRYAECFERYKRLYPAVKQILKN